MKFLSRFEDPNNRLLGPTLNGLQTWGLWKPKWKHKLFHLLAFIVVIMEYIELWIIRSNLELALRNFSFTMLCTVSVFKATTFVLWQKPWAEIIEYVTGLEKNQISKKDKKTNAIIAEYTKYSRRVTYFYWGLVAVTVFIVILRPLFSFMGISNRTLIRNGSVPYPEIISSWMPFNRTRGTGYWFTAIVHVLFCFYGGGVVAMFDSNVMVLMSFFVGQLKLLSWNCSRLFGDGEGISYKAALRRIKECHQHHVDLVKYVVFSSLKACIGYLFFLIYLFLFRFSAILNSLLSPVMFLYVIICSLMFCASAVQLTTVMFS
uniref:Odorant Receptor 42 n=1 Tax=Dendrolimus punctatus TaxID=238572 RepID=A0A2K8GKV8_9NEOP|nr:Odorant Receptor 42 [Dendrolimus punctatus]